MAVWDMCFLRARGSPDALHQMSSQAGYSLSKEQAEKTVGAWATLRRPAGRASRPARVHLRRMRSVRCMRLRECVHACARAAPMPSARPRHMRPVPCRLRHAVRRCTAARRTAPNATCRTRRWDANRRPLCAEMAGVGTRLSGNGPSRNRLSGNGWSGHGRKAGPSLPSAALRRDDEVDEAGDDGAHDEGGHIHAGLSCPDANGRMAIAVRRAEPVRTPAASA